MIEDNNGNSLESYYELFVEPCVCNEALWQDCSMGISDSEAHASKKMCKYIADSINLQDADFNQYNYGCID